LCWLKLPAETGRRTPFFFFPASASRSETGGLVGDDG